MAARDANTARRIPLVAAALRLVLLFLLVLPGAIAISLPTPQSKTVVRNENGTIFHEITVVPPEDAQGHGLVPAHVDPATHAAIVGANGLVQLNYELATPKMVMHFLPTGLLGLGIAALLASLMSGLAGGVTAFTAVFAFDLFPPICRLVNRPPPSDRGLVRLGRRSAVGAIAIAASVALVAGASPRTSVDSSLAALLLAFSLGSAPQLPTYLLGMYSKRATSVGAFAGLLAGLLASLALHGLSLPVDAHAGLSGGWIAPVFRYPGFVAQSLAIAAAGFTLNLLMTATVSLSTQPRPEKDLLQLVHSMLPIQKKQLWWKRPETLALAILLSAILVGIFLA